MLNQNEVLRKFNVNPENLIPQIQGARPTVRIEDRICSAGKTSDMIAGLNPLRQYLIVTPLLDDVQSIIDRADIPLSQPEARPGLLDAADPHSILHTKRGHLYELLSCGQGIVCTHALYSDIAWAAREGYLTGYDIIIDEIPRTSEVLTSGAVNAPEGQVNALVWKNQYLRDGYAVVTDTGQVLPTEKWRKDVKRGENAMSQTLFCHAEAGCLWSSAETVLVWELPKKLLTVGRSVTVMTYRLRGSLLQAFMDKHDIRYEVHQNIEEENRLRVKARELISVKPILGLEGMKFSANSLDSTKLKPAERSKLVNALKRLRGSDLKNAEPGSVLVTCLKGLWYQNGKSEADLPADRKPGQGPICKIDRKTTGLFNISRWSANITRGTNDFRDCDIVLYLYDKHLHPSIARTLGVPTSGEFNDLYAVSEAVQFIYRSAIRKRDNDGKGDPYVPLTIYMPSARMRGLIQQWLSGEI